MNNIEILENYVKELNENKKNHKLAYSTGFGKYWSDFGKAIENLIQENKELKEVLEKVSKDLDNIAYDQIPIEMQRAFGKEYNLGYRLGWYNAEEDWKSKVKGKIDELGKQAEKVKNHYKGTYACLDEYLNAKSKIQGFKELLEEGE